MALVLCSAGGLSAPATAAPSAAPAPAQTFATPALAEGNARFLDGAVRDLLGRASTPPDRARWLRGLESGQVRGAFAKEVARTPEWTKVVVSDLYAQVFNRVPDDGGLVHWSTQLGAGMRSADLAAFLYESAEFYEASGSTVEGYVDRLYLHILQRLPDAGGRAYWIAQLEAGRSRGVLARLIFLSVEGNGARVDVLYSRLLNRAPDTSGRAYWAQILVDTDDLMLAGLLVGSDEYFTAAQTRFQSASITTTAGTTVLLGPDFIDLTVQDSGWGAVRMETGGVLPPTGTRLLVSDGRGGMAAGTVVSHEPLPNGSTNVWFSPADLTEILSAADVRSTVELPRDSVAQASRMGAPGCAAGSAELDAGHRLTSDVGFDGRLRFDKAAGTYDVAAVVSISSNLTSVMSAGARTEGCHWGRDWTTGDFSQDDWASDAWSLVIPAGPVDIPLRVDIRGHFAMHAAFDADFRTSTAAGVPCRIGFTATDVTGPVSAVGCGTVTGRSSAAPGNAGRATDSTTFQVAARIGPVTSGVSTNGTLEPRVTTGTDLAATPWWSVDLTVDGDASAAIRLTPWASRRSWPVERVVDHRLTEARSGSVAPRARVTVVTSWLRGGVDGRPYATDLVATGGVPGHRWSAEGLPSGLAISGGRIVGTPGNYGMHSVVLTATDANGDSASRTVSLTINAGWTTTAFERITDARYPQQMRLPELSADGRFVVFGSNARDLVPFDDNGPGGWDVFTLDTSNGVLTRITHGRHEEISWFEGYSISADGRYIAFESASSTLVAGDRNGRADIFLWDRATGGTTRLTDGNGRSGAPSISSDGNRVVFASDATDLVPGDANGVADVFLWTRGASTIARLPGTDGGSRASLSGDGGHAGFSSPDGFVVMDIGTGVRTVVAAGPTESSDLSFDGSFAVFTTRDSQLYWTRSTGLTQRLAGPAQSPPAISDDGATVAYDRFLWTGRVYQHEVVVRDAATGTEQALANTGNDNALPAVSADGSTVAFGSDASLVPGDTNSRFDIHLWHRPAPPG
jgi:Tol biopolymer transport system component